MRPVLFAIGVSLVGACSAPASPSGVSEPSLLKDLLEQSSIDAIANDVSAAKWTAENLELFDALWHGRDVGLSEAERKRMDNVAVRLALSSVLMQAARQCKIDSPVDEYRPFVLQSMQSKDLETRARAVQILGLAGNESDIAVLERVVREEKEGFAEEAAISISFIRTKPAMQALKRIRSDVKRASLRTYIDGLLTEYARIPYREEPKCVSGSAAPQST